MTNVIATIVDLLLPHLNLSEQEIEQLIEIPTKPGMGDYSLPCFRLAKMFRRAPQEIAEELASNIEVKPPLREVRNVGGYLNFFVDPQWLMGSVLSKILAQGPDYARSSIGYGKTVVIDFSSPNIAKHLAVHHLRSTMIGNALYRIHRACGYRCVGINHLGDWGTQFGQLIVALKRWGSEEDLEAPDAVTRLNALYVRFHKEAEENPALEEEARQWFALLESGNPEARRLWERFRQVSLAEFHRVYEMLGVHFDYELGESFFNDKMDAVIEVLEEKGLARISEGALVVDLSEEGMPPCLLRKADGSTLYATRDLAAALWRYEQFRFDRMLYVVGGDQKLHFRQVFKVLQKMGVPWWDACVHVDFGLVRFKGGKMSTRRGEVILLEDVLLRAVDLVREIIAEKNPELANKETVAKQVGIGAVVFAELKNRRTKDVLFDWDEVLNFDGETGPYVQYTHARIASVLRKYGKSVSEEVDVSLLKEEEELAIAKRLAELPSVIERAANACEPCFVSDFLLRLCSDFNRYYRYHRILGEDETLTRARVALVACVKTALAAGLDLLGIAAPEEM